MAENFHILPSQRRLAFCLTSLLPHAYHAFGSFITPKPFMRDHTRFDSAKPKRQSSVSGLWYSSCCFHTFLVWIGDCDWMEDCAWFCLKWAKTPIFSEFWIVGLELFILEDCLRWWLWGLLFGGGSSNWMFHEYKPLPVWEISKALNCSSVIFV